MKKILYTLIAAATLQTARAQLSWQPAGVVTGPALAGYTLASTENDYVYASNYFETLISRSGGSPGSWTLLSSAPTGAPDIYANDRVLFKLSNKGVYRSTDFGATWTLANNGLIGNDSTRLAGMIALDSVHWILIHRGDNVKKVYVSNNNGLNWSTSINLTSSNSVASVLSDGIGNVYVFAASTIYRSTSWGDYLNPLTVNYPVGGAGLAVLFSDATALMANSKGLYKARSAGWVWSTITPTGLPAGFQVRSLIKSPTSDTVYISTQVSTSNTYDVYESHDLGQSWNVVTANLPANPKIGGYGAFSNKLHIARNGYLFAGPDSMDIYRTSAPVAQSNIVVRVGIAKTASQTTLSISPNPVHSFLTLSIQTKAPVADITVVNALGQVQRQERILTGGSEKIVDVAPLPAGRYFLRVVTGAESKTLPFVKQ